MSYYKYKERVKEDLKPVDYGAIQTGVNKAFEEIQTQQADKREARETDIAELRTDVNKELEQAREAARSNKGDDTFNAQVLSMANQSAQHMRALENLLRAGKINPSDYAIQRQNLMDSVTQLRVVTAAYKDSINQAVTRQEDDLAGVIEAHEMDNVQGVLDLENHQLMIDPTSGMVRMHDRVNGTSEGIGDVQVRMMNKYNKYDFTGKVGEYAKLLDTVIEDNGYVRTENPFSLAGGRNLEASIRENFVNGISENDKASILLDSSTGYSIIQGVRSEADYEKWKKTASADEIDKGIWLKPDSKLGGRVNAVLQTEQKDAVVEKAIQEVKAQTKYSKTITPRDKSAAQIEKEQKRELTIQEAKSNLNLLHDIYTGDKDEKNRALAAYSAELKAQYKGFDNIKIDGNQLVISYKGLVTKDGKKQIVAKTERIDIDKESFKKFAQTAGKAILGNNNLISIYDEASVGIDNLDSPFKEEAGGFTVETEVEEEPQTQDLLPYSDVVELVSGRIKKVKQGWRTSSGTAFQMYEDAIRGSLSDMGVQGATVERAEDKVTITLPNGRKLPPITLTEEAETKTKVKDILQAIHTAVGEGDESFLDRLVGGEEEVEVVVDTSGTGSKYNTGQ